MSNLARTTRRRFMSLIGVGAASGPLAVKAANDAHIARLVRAEVGSSGSRYGDQGPPQSEGDSIPYDQRVIRASDYINTFGIPPIVESRLRDEARWCDRLDPDIACKVSWSMSVKFATQRQRNYERGLEQLKQTGWRQRGRNTLKAMFGFDWPF